VESLDFVGEVYEAQVRVGDERLLARIAPDMDVGEGDTVRIVLDPAHCLLLSA
jgi:iron(III) transport system ATP-binding protein